MQEDVEVVPLAEPAEPELAEPAEEMKQEEPEADTVDSSVLSQAEANRRS